MDKIISIIEFTMFDLNLLTASDIQQQLAGYLQQRRKQLKLSRAALAERSTVPAPTIKHFETSGQISLRQFLLLWQCVDDLQNLAALTASSEPSDPPANFATELSK